MGIPLGMYRSVEKQFSYGMHSVRNATNKGTRFLPSDIPYGNRTRQLRQWLEKPNLHNRATVVRNTFINYLHPVRDASLGRNGGDPQHSVRKQRSSTGWEIMQPKSSI
ncbi:MAG: hypothetical protein LBE91_01105 [Tannerella sp.]|nr:hypothetical protein [Tannerella sp.]